MPTALITGISGQTGSYLAEQLEESNWVVHGIEQQSDQPGSNELNNKHFGTITDSRFVESVIEEVNPDAVFNLAALSSVAECWKKPALAFEINALGAANLLEAISRQSLKVSKEISFVQASSAEIFGHPSQSPQNEQTALQPLNPYGASKAAAHFLTQNFRSKGVSASNAILFNHESPRRPDKFVTRKITKAVSNIVRGKQDKLLLGYLGTRRDWGWAPEYATALTLIANAKTPDDFVIATGSSHSIEEFVSLAFEHVGINDWRKFVEIDPALNRPSDSPDFVGDNSKIRNNLGWIPKLQLKNIVEEMVDFDLLNS